MRRGVKVMTMNARKIKRKYERKSIDKIPIIKKNAEAKIFYLISRKLQGILYSGKNELCYSRAELCSN